NPVTRRIHANEIESRECCICCRDIYITAGHGNRSSLYGYVTSGYSERHVWRSLCCYLTTIRDSCAGECCRHHSSEVACIWLSLRYILRISGIWNRELYCFSLMLSRCIVSVSRGDHRVEQTVSQ